MEVTASRLLLLVRSTSYRAGAFLDAARRLGVPVTVGTDRAQALAPLQPAGHLALDFADVRGAVHAVATFARAHPIRAVLAADDDGVALAAEAARALGVPHAAPEAVLVATHKGRLRRRLGEAGLPQSRFAVVGVEPEPSPMPAGVGFPCVLKPMTLAGSRGVIRADDAAAFEDARRRIAAILAAERAAGRPEEETRDILVESYLDGEELALEGLLGADGLRVLALFDKPDPLTGPFFEETLYVTPSRVAREAQRAAVDEVAAAARAIGLDRGPVHAEVRFHGGRPHVLEIAPRSIGGLCSRTLRFGDRVTLEELILRDALGEPVDDLERERLAAGVLMVPIPRAGVLEAVSGQEQARAVPGVEEVRITMARGERVIPLPEAARYLGFVFARAREPEQVEAALREAGRRLNVRIAPVDETASARRIG